MATQLQKEALAKLSGTDINEVNNLFKDKFGNKNAIKSLVDLSINNGKEVAKYTKSLIIDNQIQFDKLKIQLKNDINKNNSDLKSLLNTANKTRDEKSKYQEDIDKLKDQFINDVDNNHSDFNSLLSTANKIRDEGESIDEKSNYQADIDKLKAEGKLILKTFKEESEILAKTLEAKVSQDPLDLLAEKNMALFNSKGIVIPKVDKSYSKEILTNKSCNTQTTNFRQQSIGLRPPTTMTTIADCG